MLKKRIIFTLLYCDGNFFQSRNFNIQRVGNVEWLEKNYNFKKISYYIDELLVIDISRNERKIEKFLRDLNLITKFCFIPISVGGGINSIKLVKKILALTSDFMGTNEINYSLNNIKRYGIKHLNIERDYPKSKEYILDEIERKIKNYDQYISEHLCFDKNVNGYDKIIKILKEKNK